MGREAMCACTHRFTKHLFSERHPGQLLAGKCLEPGCGCEKYVHKDWRDLEEA
ncbi:hypothetical protein LCGC14_2002230 [marine sediment metagenome]|uniref:Uncharacterized protein n=1 Tax=marine sediment metagenome TaxID=412755 RepID=A0A0F9FQI4_9ZZZZ